jgi:hypothetical protein
VAGPPFSYAGFEAGVAWRSIFVGRSMAPADQPPHAIPPEKLPVWELVPLMTFVVLNVVICSIWLDRIASLPDRITPFTMFLVGLATYRLANIIANERITKIFRAPFVDVKVSQGKEEEVPKRRGVREMVGRLIYCPSCVGVWIAALFVYGLTFAPVPTWVAAAIFAVSAVERLLTSLTYRLEAD